jgi:cis-L-3-hydroxyproline dehydratase
MAMKLTKRQQDMLDGKLGECKKFCMDKLVDFGEAVEATEMVDVVLVLNQCPIATKDRTDIETAKKLAAYDLGASPLYDPIFAMKDAHVADETGTQCGNDPYFVQFDKQHVKDAGPWNFEIPGKGSFKVDDQMVTDLKTGYDKLMEHGWLPWLSCNPYNNTRIPKMGEYAASSESSAACYINTILGARTNRECATNTVYCAYTGCLPKYLTHLDENRAAKCIVELTTRSGTTCREVLTGPPWAPALPRRRATGSWPCSICPARWVRRGPSRSSRAPRPA